MIPLCLSASSAAVADPGLERVEALLKRHLEELHFSFGDEPLVDLEGFLICEDGCRAIIAAEDLDPCRRIFLYLHCLGHLALGHIDERRLSLTYELRDRWRLPPHLQARETAADAWALRLLDQPRESAGRRANPFRQPVLQELRNLRMPPGFSHACLERHRADLAASPSLVQQLRQQAAPRRLPSPHHLVRGSHGSRRPRRSATG